MTIRAVVHPEEAGGYWAEVPSLPGCVTEGDTIDAVVAHLREAIEGWKDSRREFDPGAEVITSETHNLELCLLTKAAA